MDPLTPTAMKNSFSAYIRSMLAAAALAVALLATGCEDVQETAMEELTDGYWVPADTAEAQYLISFDRAWRMFYYQCVPVGKGFDACYDAAVQPHSGYAVDAVNGRLCFLPNEWYDILVLDATTLTLSSSDGQNTVRFVKVAGKVVVLSPEEFRERHPEAVERDYALPLCQ